MNQSPNYLMAENMILWTPLPFTIGDPNNNSRDRTPKCSFEELSQKKTKTTTQNKWLIKLFR